MDEQIRIMHPDVDNYGFTTEEALPVWLDLGWSVVDDDEEKYKHIPTFTVRVDADGGETMEETPLPDEKESEQDVTAEPKES